MMFFAGDLKLQRHLEQELSAATVKATRIKFYNRGDTLVCDAFDMLGRLSNVTQFLTTALHSETHYNSIPRYVRFHVIYRFHVNPKKK